MNFKEAYEQLKDGKPIKRQDWDGYWVLEDGDVIIHLKDGYDLGLTYTEDIMFTLSHMTEEDWEIATEDNCNRLKEDKVWIV